jgi:hypothetical protein
MTKGVATAWHAFRIAFKYEWEELPGFVGREPTHYLYFYARDLE